MKTIYYPSMRGKEEQKENFNADIWEKTNEAH